MNDERLLIFGCVVSFVALAGVYVYIRERFQAGPAEPKARAETKAERELRQAG